MAVIDYDVWFLLFIGNDPKATRIALHDENMNMR